MYTVPYRLPKIIKNGDTDEKPPGPLVLFSFVKRKKNGVQWELSDFLQSKLPLTGLLLQTNKTGVVFPLIHYKEDDGTFEKRLTTNYVYENTILQQGLYREVRNICPEDELEDINYIQTHTVGFIIMGFKMMDRNFSQVMIESWKDWTGARYTYMYLPDDLGLSRIRFFTRQAPNNSDMFTYVVTIECRNITDNNKYERLVDFARRLQMQKMNGYISVYRISQQNRHTVTRN